MAVNRLGSPYSVFTSRTPLLCRTGSSSVEPLPTVVPTEIPRAFIHGWGASLEQIREILHEYVAIIVYWWRGWI